MTITINLNKIDVEETRNEVQLKDSKGKATLFVDGEKRGK